jgi:hypothetical protein
MMGCTGGGEEGGRKGRREGERERARERAREGEREVTFESISARYVAFIIDATSRWYWSVVQSCQKSMS